MAKADVTEVAISSDLLAQIEAMPDVKAGSKQTEFTAEDDQVILKYFRSKPKDQLCRLVGRNPYTGERGCSAGTMLRRFKELTKEKDNG